MAIKAWKRQVETLEDTRSVIDALSVLAIKTWLERARMAALQNDDDGCNAGREVLVRGRSDESVQGDGCEEATKLQWSWSSVDYERRMTRTERWINVARSEGHETREVGLIGVRADLLRKRGIETKEPGLLISSFAGTHEFRTRTGIVDPEIEKGELVLIIDPVLEMVELEAEIALTCADRQYIETLVREVGGAQLWCPRISPVGCDGRPSWKRNLVEALEYAIGRRKERRAEERVEEYRGSGSERVWLLAEHAKKWIEDGGVNDSLCPNRPQGITERQEERKEKVVNKRTRKYQEVERTVRCELPERVWTIAPKIPFKLGEMTTWREEVGKWIKQNYRQVDQDIQVIRECEGEPE